MYEHLYVYVYINKYRYRYEHQSTRMPARVQFEVAGFEVYRGTMLKRKRTPLGPYRRPMPRVLGGSQGVVRFIMSKVPLYGTT